MKKVVIYCDGAARNNGKDNNVGGFGAVLRYGDHVKTIKAGFRNVTNNMMEIRAAIEALKQLKTTNIPVEINTDSAYLCNCMNQGRYKKWMNNGWVTAGKKPVENRQLWIELIELVEQFPFITFNKVKGHSGIPDNELADRLANEAMDELTRGAAV